MLKIILIIIAIWLLIWIFKLWSGANFIKKEFARCNILVFGAKGTGKDLLFNKAIKKRKKEYLSNIDYGGKFEEVELASVSLGDNSFENFIDGNIKIVNKNNNWEGKDIYFSDLGVYTPSHEDNRLNKLYKSLPIYAALQRHLYRSNFHGNSQAIIRTWKKLREQGDGYFRTRSTFKLPFLPVLITRAIYYSEYDSAEKCLLPMKMRGLSNDANRALIEQHRATHGVIKEVWFATNIKRLKYDTYYFHKKVFGMTYKDWKKQNKIKK